MRTAALPFALFAVALTAGLSSAQAAPCSCEEPSECTTVNNLPIVFAVRDVVRKRFLDLGARLLEHDTWVDNFSAPAAVPYTHVTAFYAEGRRLAKLRFVYPKDDFEGIIRDYASFNWIAEQVTQSSVGKRWRMGDGAEISVWHDDEAAFADFTALAMDAELSAQLRPNYQSPITKNAPPPRVNPSASLSIATSNPHQGLFEFHSEGALLLGKHDLREEVCGLSDDFDWTTLAQQRKNGFVEDRSLRVEFDSKGRATVKLALNDDYGADIFRFLDVRPGVPTRAAVDGDCRRRKVSVTYTATHTPLCLVVDATNQPAYQVVQKLVEVTGVRIDGAELLPREKSRVTFSDLEMDAAGLLRLLSDVTDLELVEKGPTHFEFRVSAKPTPKPVH